MTRIDWDEAALEALASHPAMREMLDDVATQVRNRARDNASGYYAPSRRISAIITESGTDRQGAFADVGYDRTHPGFVLFFSEVGTSRMSPRPHLRAAVEQTRI